DANVIQFAGSSLKPRAEGVINCLKTLQETEGYQLTISEYTMFENLRGLSGERWKKALEAILKYERKVVSDEVLFLASLLSTLYNDEGYKTIDSGDIILTATAMLIGGSVITANHKDFPPPFLHTEKSLSIAYVNGHFTQHLDLAIYKPNYELVH